MSAMETEEESPKAPPDAPTANGHAGSTEPIRVPVESSAEWQVHDILYNGTERHLQPLVFSDHVAKLAHKVDWQSLVGDHSVRDDPEAYSEATDEDEEEAPKAKKPRPGQNAGPWDAVAKKLQAGLTEINVLLDVIRMGLRGRYLELGPVFEAEKLEKERESRAKTAHTAPDQDFKKTALVSKRKAVNAAANILVTLQDNHQRRSAGGEASGDERFLAELKAMRQRFRLKKLGKLILGDLGYAPSGNRFLPPATFEVRRKTPAEEATTTGPPSILAVTLPRPLRKALTLRLYVHFDAADAEGGPPKEAPAPADPKDEAPPAKSVKTEPGLGAPLAEEEAEAPSGLSWNEELKRAQETLLCKDLFLLLAREAVELEGRVCIVLGERLSVSLGHGFLLTLCLVPADAPDDSATSLGRSKVLETNLRRLYQRHLTDQVPLIQRPVTLPLVLRGSKRRSDADVIAQRRRPKEVTERGLLGRLLRQASHLLLCRRTLAVLSAFERECEDPTVTVSWVEAGSVFSILRVQMATKNVEVLPRSFFCLELGREGVVVISGAEAIPLGPDERSLKDLLWVMARTHQLSEAQSVVRGLEWRLLYSTSALATPHGTLLPTLLASDASGARAVALRLPLQGPPEIFVQRLITEEQLKRRVEGVEGLVEAESWALLRGGFKRLPFGRLRGESLVQKLETLLYALNTASDKSL